MTPPTMVTIHLVYMILMDGQWVKIGSMSSGRWKCLVVTPSPDKMMIVGGWGALDSVEECVVM